MTLASLSLSWVLLAQPAAPPKTPAPQQAVKAKETVIEGVVVDQAAKPVEGALVVIRPLQGSSDVPLSVRTDAKGAFQVRLRGEPLVSIQATAKDLAPARLERFRPGSPLKIVLEAGGAIDGIVRDGLSKQPIGGVRVEARGRGGLDVPWEWATGTNETVSGADGRFRLRGLGRGMYRVVASAHEWGRAQRDFVKAGSQVELFLFARATISGRVTDRSGRSVARASMFAEREAAMGQPEMSPPVVSDREGQFEIAGLEAGIYRIVALERGHAPTIVPGIVLGRQDDQRVDVTLEPGADVIGRLVDPEQRPVQGKVAIVDLDGQRVSFAVGQVLFAEASADGRFRLKSVPPGDHGLGVAARGFAPKRVELSVGNEAVDLGEVVLEVGLAIRGRVRDAAGAPIADARVAALRSFSTGRASRPAPPASTTSEAEGRFTLAGLSPGAYQVRAEALGFGSATRSTEAGSESLDLVLQPAGSLLGKVVDESGRAVGFFHVLARETGRPMVGSVAPQSASKIVEGGDGTFTLEDVGAGEYVVEIGAPDSSPHVTSKVVVSAGASTDLGRVVLKKGGTVKGTVVDSVGSAVPGATVRLDGPGIFSRLSEAQTAAGGEFELRGIDPGRVALAATHPDYAEGRVEGLDVDPAKGPSETQIVLPRGGRIEGVVRKRDGGAVSGIAIGLAAIGSTGQTRFSSQGMMATRSDGSFVFERVAPGRVMLTLMVGREGLRTSTQIKESEVTEGATTQVDFTLSDILVSGYARLHGIPLSGARLDVRPRSTRVVVMGAGAMSPVAASPTGPERNAATVREDGSFELIVDRPGPYSVMVSTGDDKTRLALREIDIPDADSFAIDLDYAGVRVTGVVTGEGERPVPQAEVSARGAGALSGSDGRFALELGEAGKTILMVRAEGYVAFSQELTVPESGLSDLMLALKHGGDLAGRVVDIQGRGVAGAFVIAVPTAESTLVPGMVMQPSQPDGSFVLSGVAQGSLMLLARTQNSDAFAVLSNVDAGARDVVLTLRPAGRVVLHITGPDGRPVEGAGAGCTQLNGARLIGIGALAASDAQGVLAFSVPAGVVEIRASKDKLRGRADVTVTAGETTTVVIELAERP